MMKCFQAKARQLDPQWYVIDASNAVVGRLAAQIAPILMGKHRPTYTRHIDTGDYVIVTNVDKVVYTGDKWNQKVYRHYSGYPGGLKEVVAWKLFQQHPERILWEAVRRMMPKSTLGRHMMSKLKLYVGPDHPHQAQQPSLLETMTGRPGVSGAIYAPPQPPPQAPARKKKRRPAGEVRPIPSDDSHAAGTPVASEPVTDDAPASEPEPESIPSPPPDETGKSE